MPENTYNSSAEPQDIPDVLKVPDGNVLLLQAYGKGVQIYDCPFVDFAKATPHAILFTGDSDEGDLVAIHFKGPSWQATDGSIGKTGLPSPRMAEAMNAVGAQISSTSAPRSSHSAGSCSSSHHHTAMR